MTVLDKTRLIDSLRLLFEFAVSARIQQVGAVSSRAGRGLRNTPRSGTKTQTDSSLSRYIDALRQRVAGLGIDNELSVWVHGGCAATALLQILSRTRLIGLLRPESPKRGLIFPRLPLLTIIPRTEESTARMLPGDVFLTPSIDFRPVPKRDLSDRLLQTDARRICLIKPSALGDVVQTLPLLGVLKERFPEADLSWVIQSELAELLEGHPCLDEIILFERRGGISHWRWLLAELKKRRFDLVFDLQGLLRTGIMTWSTRAPLRIGLQTAREGSQLACHTLLPDTGKRVPAHLRYWRAAEALGMGNCRRETCIPIGDDDRIWARDRLESLRKPVLAVHPGGRWRTKRWPVEKFAVVAAKAARHFGFSTVVLGSRREYPYAAQFENVLNRFVPTAPVLNLAGSTSLKQLAAVLESSDVMLTNDSGPMHLAAALGVPVVGIFTCTSPVRSGPPGDQHEWVVTNLSCAARYKKKCPYRGKKHMACFEEISTERVWQAFVRVMNKNFLQDHAA